MDIGKKFRLRKAPLSSLLPKTVYMHVLDTTEGIPGNRPMIVYSTNKRNPFGTPHIDYSACYPWTFIKLVRED